MSGNMQWATNGGCCGVRKDSLLLGQASLGSINVYTRADPTEKLYASTHLLDEAKKKQNELSQQPYFTSSCARQHDVDLIDYH